MQYLLDTDICIYIANQHPTGVRARFNRRQPGDIGISIITYLELVYGAWKSGRREANLARIHRFIEAIAIHHLDRTIAAQYAELRCDLEKRGSLIAAHDLLIAAHALSLDLTLVTNNVREFSRVRGLRVENWAR